MGGQWLEGDTDIPEFTERETLTSLYSVLIAHYCCKYSRKHRAV